MKIEKYYKKYNLLNSIFKKILLKHNDLIVSSINFLHILSPHPEHLKIYDDFIKFRKNKKKLFSFLKNFLFNREKNNQFKIIEKKNTEVDFLIISHLVNKKFFLIKKDLYFGDLQKDLNKKKIKNLFVLINHTEFSSNKIKKKKNKTSKIILTKNLLLAREIILLIKIITKFIYCRFLNIFEKNKLEKKIVSKTFIFKNIFQALQNLILYEKVQKIIKISKPKYVITTFEGYAFERLIFKSCSEINKQIIKFGYQFSFIRKNQKSIMNKIGNGYDPDIILSTGSQKTNIFKKNSNWKKIINVGSPKYNIIKNKIKKLNKYILVTPEAFEMECLKLFKFSNSIAKNLKNYKFIWRLHPLMDNKILKEIIKNNVIEQNIIISKSSLQSDIKKSSYVLYRGSATAIECAINGLIPIYYKNNEKFTIDPLYEVNKNNEVNNLSDIKYLLKNVKKNKKIINYSKMYYEKQNWNKIFTIKK